VQALIFTILVQVSVLLLKATLLRFGSRVFSLAVWTDTVQLVWSLVLAAALGLFAVWATNTDSVHVLLRKFRITHQTSFPSEWYGAFSQNEGFVVLHLKKGA
jgi:hypothetical protein